MKTSSIKKNISLLGVVALSALTFTAIPTLAHAAPACATAGLITQCVGVTSDAAPYVMQVPANFNGTAFIYSHGYRYNVDIPAGIPLIGGYKITNTPQPGPVPGGSTAVIAGLLGKGYAVMGSGFARQGWNADSGVATDVELIKLFKTQFTATKHIVAWGESLGGFITQGLAETHPELIDAAAPMCMAAGSVQAELKTAGDFLWGIKTFFDPSIKAGNYSAGAAGYAESMADLVKVFTVMGKLQAGVSSGAWPDTSPKSATDLLGAIPSRSVLLMIGLMAGVPTQSAHFDGTTGPGNVNTSAYTGFALAASPALAILENGTNAAALAVLATIDIENQSGGAVYDNTKTNYAAQVSSEAAIYNAGLSGSSAIGGMLAYIAAAPRATGDVKAMAKETTLLQHTGKINVPTITMAGLADPVTPAGNSQWIAEQYAGQYASERAAAMKAYKPRPVPALISIWGVTPAHYTTFSSLGAPITSTPAANGTNHCNFTVVQYQGVANLLIYAAQNSKNMTGGAVRTLVRKMKGSVLDPNLMPPLLKYYVQD